MGEGIREQWEGSGAVNDHEVTGNGLVRMFITLSEGVIGEKVMVKEI